MTRRLQAGQSLIALLAFMAVAMTVTMAATAIVITNALATTKYSLGQEALAIAEAGVDNAVLRLVRDPSYTGETLTVGAGTATITISGTTTKTITSVGLTSTFRRTIVVTATAASNTVTITNWTETP